MKLKFKKDWSTHKTGNVGNFENNIASHLIGLGVAETVTSEPVLKPDEKPIKKRGRKTK